MFQKNLQRQVAGRGVHGTAQYLADVSPATKAYRPLRKKFCTIAGVPWQGSNHTDPNRGAIVARVRNLLEEEGVYEIKANRRDIMNNEIVATKDILLVRAYMRSLFAITDI